MSLRDLKGATKDINLVVPDGDAYGQLWAVLMDFGYTKVQSLDPDYRAMGATSCVENDDGCRLDIFNQQVANKLVLTDGMQERSEPFLNLDRLMVRLVSNEDIFLSKAIAGRDDDIEDWQATYDVEAWEELEQSLADGDLASDELQERRDVITRWEENLENRRLIKHALALYSDVEVARDQRIDVGDRTMR